MSAKEELIIFEKWLKDNGCDITNPWLNVANKIESHGIYFESANVDNLFIGCGDEECGYRFKSYGTDGFRNDDYVVNVPPEPWQGNPLTASLIILTLNPGFVEKQNIDIAVKIQNDEDAIKRIIAFKKATLLLESESFLPTEMPVNKDNVEKKLTTADYVNIIGDWYWYKRFLPLKSETGITDDEEFFRKIAIVQNIPYQSVDYKGRNIKFCSQQYTLNLLRYVLERERDVTILALRSAAKWKDLLNTLLPEDSKLREGKEHTLFTIKGKSIMFNYNRSQALSMKNLKKDIYTKLIESFKR